MNKPCESCGAPGPLIETGPFAGSREMHAYCAHCSRDLCSRCMKIGRCPDSPDGKHHPEDED